MLVTCGICVTQVWESFPTVDGEHDNFGGHSRHFVREAVSIHAVHVSLESVLSVADPIARLNNLTVGAHDAEINVKETTFGHFKGQT